jgi:hypothetical protein
MQPQPAPYHDQTRRSLTRQSISRAQRRLRPVVPRRRQAKTMHTMIRQSHLPPPTIPKNTALTASTRLSTLWTIVRPIRWWCFRSLVVCALFYVAAVAFVVHEIQTEG